MDDKDRMRNRATRLFALAQKAREEGASITRMNWLIWLPRLLGMR